MKSHARVVVVGGGVVGVGHHGRRRNDLGHTIVRAGRQGAGCGDQRHDYRDDVQRKQAVGA